MDFVAKQKRKDVPYILAETMEAFKPLWEKKRSQIESVPKKTFNYGNTERHQLDVYYPPSASMSGSKPPILLFTYGGGLYIGDRSLQQCNHLVYGNLGAFFSTNGYVTVVADYRLIPSGAKYPDPVDDIHEAFQWIVDNLWDEADVDRVFMMGHSAGAIIQSTMLLRPEGKAAGLHKRVKGVILNGGIYDLNQFTSMNPSFVSAYFGDAHRAARYMPHGILKNASKGIIASLPPILLVAAENEPDETYAQTDSFGEALRERGAKDVTMLETKGHSHVSANYALFTGKGEEWGYQVLEWMKAR